MTCCVGVSECVVEVRHARKQVEVIIRKVCVVCRRRYVVAEFIEVFLGVDRGRRGRRVFVVAGLDA